MIDRRMLALGALPAALASLLRAAPGRAAGPATQFEVTRSEEEWRTILTPEQFHVLREHGTERAGSSPLDALFRPGTYLCAGCDLALFSSQTKFHSGTGWPSFYAPLESAVLTSIDKSFFMTRTEVHCRRCGGHLGHVFNDGPEPTGLRYCMNGVALKFRPESAGKSS
jgi:peptide-methionine (R)-S-oxide reductase